MTDIYNYKRDGLKPVHSIIMKNILVIWVVYQVGLVDDCQNAKKLRNMG